MTLLGREAPPARRGLVLPCRTADAACLCKKDDPNPPVLLGEAVRLVAKIGGYLGLKNDPPPGHQLTWQGYAAFRLMAMGFALRDQTILQRHFRIKEQVSGFALMDTPQAR